MRRPARKGLATVHDRDVLIFCISQLMSALNAGRNVSRVLRLRAHELLVATNRGTDGRGYEQLKASLERLAGTRIETNVSAGGREEIDGFGMIDRYKIVRETRDGRMQELEITLSDWVFNAIEAREVLTLDRDYFRLRKPLERRLYELARKHCGAQASWLIGLEHLQIKCGSASTLKEFRRLVGDIIDADAAFNHLPDYAISWRDAKEDAVMFTSLKTTAAIDAQNVIAPVSADAIETARGMARGFDVYAIEAEWRAWIHETRKPLPRDADAAFLGFVREWAKNHAGMLAS